MTQNRTNDWLKQAENDLEWCSVSVREGFYSQACFIAQQAGEKAVKALAFKRGVDRIKSHSIAAIARELSLEEKIPSAGRLLDQYYISARYPDALPEGAPYEFFSEQQAQQAFDQASLLVEKIRHLTNPTSHAQEK